MIYPSNFEQKIGFTDIRRLLRGNCLSTLGSEMVDKISFSADVETVNEWLRQTREFRQLQEEDEDFPLQYFFDMRVSVARIRLENTHLEENELFDLYRSLITINDIVKFLRKTETGDIIDADDETILVLSEKGTKYGYVANSSGTVAHGTHSAGYIYRDFDQEAGCVVRFRLDDVAIAELISKLVQTTEDPED